jgi:V-type H+-transporting ATPase subunit G
VLHIQASAERLTQDLQQSGGNKEAEEEANKETEVKLKEIKAVEGKEGNKVVEDLLKAVTEVKPEVPDRS